MTRGGRSLAAACGIGITCALVLEIFFALYSARFPSLFRQAPDPRSLRLADARRFVEAPTFDRGLGWDADPTARPGHEGAPAVAQAYGDSFTRGAEVGDADTWPARFRALTGRSIVNLGVNGYGLDQAVLKFEQHGERFRTPVAILAIYPEQYRRADSWYAWNCLAGSDPLNYFRYAFKPMLLRDGGRWTLRPLPCRDASCLVDLLRDRDGTLDRFLASRDRCARENLARPPRRFPFTLHFLEAVRLYFQSQRSVPESGRPFFDGAESLQRAEVLVLRFADASQRHGGSPLVLLLYSERELPLLARGSRPDAALIRFLEQRRIPFVDAGAYILAGRRGRAGGGSISAPMGHLSGEGNALVARALAAHPLIRAALRVPTLPGGPAGNGSAAAARGEAR